MQLRQFDSLFIFWVMRKLGVAYAYTTRGDQGVAITTKVQPSALIFGRGRAKELLHVPDDLEHVTESIRKTTKAAKALALYGLSALVV